MTGERVVVIASEQLESFGRFRGGVQAPRTLGTGSGGLARKVGDFDTGNGSVEQR